MTPDQKGAFISVLNAKRPKLIVAYTDSIYELANFAEREGLEVLQQKAIITSAGTLYPFIRKKIEKVFQCRVFNRYGSREVGDIACERVDCECLWVAPWGSYLEIIDSAGNRVPDGTEGEILVTSLLNFAMPLVRYKIGDRGTLTGQNIGTRNVSGQFLEDVVGRIDDTFKTTTGTFIHSGYFMVILFHKAWIRKYQIVQKSSSLITYRFVKSESACQQSDLDEISQKTKFVMGENCDVVFEFVEDIPESDSGKYRYAISEI